ncbi:hypothetical protein [Pantoea phytobeneficialis]|uniref:Uncharacterized protein n=1 Tax=Pantoea phytobeneficialis TaxID=2052056 RepID=A0AAP9HB90_9GAMM|nr:hypothetical protein [Pantoea phytobeneficialis]MDO6406561.1 hypothetical protein [Pantoea phytobeneficialis]QGR09654.1 hypothetical protein CTZ24_24645 [Pantoea phytobeneficialis]
MKTEPFTHTSSAIRDPQILKVIAQMNARRPHPDAAAFAGPGAPDPDMFADYGFSIHPEQGDLIYLGGYVLNDNAEPDFLAFIRNPDNGFISVTLPIKRGTELAVKVG